MDAPIPETHGENTQYYDEALARAKASRVEVNMLSASEREQRAAARAEKGRCWNRPGRLALHPKPGEGSSLLMCGQGCDAYYFPAGGMGLGHHHSLSHFLL